MFFVGLGMLTAKKIVGEFMSIPYHLTDKQISDFKENGYLIIEKFVDNYGDKDDSPLNMETRRMVLDCILHHN